jgi:hypothetical protein
MKILDIKQGSDGWHVERFGCIGGKRLQSAVGASYSKKTGWTLGNESVQKTLLKKILSELQSEVEIDDYCSPSMQRGHDLEPESVKAASKKLGKKFEKCGMLQSDVHERYKISPDTVCYEEGVVVGGYETKSESGYVHMGYIIDGGVPKDHLWQCLAPMVMDDSVKWWVFGSYDDCNHVNPLFTVTIHREDYTDMIEEAREILSDFFLLVEDTVQKYGGKYNG